MAKKKKEKKIDPGHSVLGIVGGAIGGGLGATALVKSTNLDKYVPLKKRKLKTPVAVEGGKKLPFFDIEAMLGPKGNTKLSPSQLPKDTRRVWNQSVKDYGLKDIKVEHIDPSFRLAGKKVGSHYSPMEKIVRTRNVHAYDTMAHELGHAADMRKFPVFKSVLRGVAPGLGLLTGGAMMLSNDEDIKEKAPLALAAGAAPVLYSEGKASAIGMKTMVKTLGWRKALKGGAKLLPAFASYALVTGGPAIGMHIANNLSKKK